MLETILQSFSFITHTASKELIFKYFFCKFCLLAAMVTNQINKNGMFGRGSLKEHFCKSFVKKKSAMSMMRWQ